MEHINGNLDQRRWDGGVKTRVKIKTKHRNNVNKYSLLNRCINYCNKLKTEASNAMNIHKFKTILDIKRNIKKKKLESCML